MRLDATLILVFGVTVASGWSAMLGVLVYRHTSARLGRLLDIIPLQDFLLLFAFASPSVPVPSLFP
jgi:hypothetical protein